MGASDKHKQLTRTALWWLYERGCSCFAEEVPTRNGIADALGVITRAGEQRVYYIEAKQSRSDLICKKQKGCYEQSLFGEVKYSYAYPVPQLHDVDYYYLIVADGVKVEPELYPEWGVLDERGKVLRRAKRMRKADGIAQHVEAIAHALVYRHYGKMYLGEMKDAKGIDK